ncbi:hypothetical protein [Sphingobacterium sp. LRF_L2]|uniref:hypothetical protein n=1 Tax=Sphingobacterium sp. LRF_L2 TaxID=3369421 RepID=UPI003F5ED674
MYCFRRPLEFIFAIRHHLAGWSLLFLLNFFSNWPSNGDRTWKATVGLIVLYIPFFYMYWAIIWKYDGRKNGRLMSAIYISLLSVFGCFIAYNALYVWFPLYEVYLTNGAWKGPEWQKLAGIFFQNIKLLFYVLLAYCIGKIFICLNEIAQIRYETALLKDSLLLFKTDNHFNFQVLTLISNVLASKGELSFSATIKSWMKNLRYSSLVAADGQQKISLAREVRAFEDFMETVEGYYAGQKIFRYNKIGRVHGHIILPMVLLTLGDNLLKHAHLGADTPVCVTLEILADRYRFEMSNVKASKMVCDEHSGTGIAMVRERLETLFPNKFIMDIVEDEMRFAVFLEIKN